MAISMHSASVPVFVRMLGNMSAGSTRPRPMPPTKKFEPCGLPELRGSRPTCCRFTRRSRSPATPPSSASPAWPASKRRSSRTTRPPSPSCAQRIRKTIDYLQSVPAAQIDGSDEREISVPRARPAPITMKGETYLKHFALPNFFFHVTTTYALLRHNGVEPRQEGLPRRAAARPALPPERSALAQVAPAPLASRQRVAAIAREVAVELGAGGARPRPGRGAARPGRRPRSRRCHSSCSERVTAIRVEHVGAAARADVARARRRSRAGRRRAPRGAPRSPNDDGRRRRDAPAAAPSQSLSGDDQARAERRRRARFDAARRWARLQLAERAAARAGERGMGRRRLRRREPSAPIVRAGGRDEGAKSAVRGRPVRTGAPRAGSERAEGRLALRGVRPPGRGGRAAHEVGGGHEGVEHAGILALAGRLAQAPVEP